MFDIFDVFDLFDVFDVCDVFDVFDVLDVFDVFDIFDILCGFCGRHHLENLASHVFFDTKRHDYFEMILHHSMTILLVSLSYFYNLYRIGTIIMFLHDSTDVFVHSSKCSVDGSNVPRTLFFYVGVFLSRSPNPKHFEKTFKFSFCKRT